MAHMHACPEDALHYGSHACMPSGRPTRPTAWLSCMHALRTPYSMAPMHAWRAVVACWLHPSGISVIRPIAGLCLLAALQHYTVSHYSHAAT